MIKQASFAMVTLLWSSATLFGQTMNTLSNQEKEQGWQLLFDGKTLAGWHVSAAPAQGGGRTAPAQPPQPGQVGTPKPCDQRIAARSGPAPAAPAGGSHWEVVDGLLTPCGGPPGYLTSDRSYKNFVLSIEFKCDDDTNSGVFVRSPQENGGYEVHSRPATTPAPLSAPRRPRAYTFKADQWNRYQITADGDHLVVELNGETTLDIHDTRFSEGHLRLQYQQFPIAFRNIKIRSLP
ncbi:MAG: hypothetical protein DMG01_29900 [Acidobacteria bacterium]|nr:MAG: hypothetical protein DMG01_29900 [Acidobacteriota bacterium]